jgi:hypothetical protein
MVANTPGRWVAVEEKFDSFDETLAFVSEEKRRIVRLPISELWKNGARFHDDESFGNESTSFKFNSYGFRALCDLVGTSDRMQRSQLVRYAGQSRSECCLK